MQRDGRRRPAIFAGRRAVHDAAAVDRDGAWSVTSAPVIFKNQRAALQAVDDGRSWSTSIRCPRFPPSSRRYVMPGRSSRSSSRSSIESPSSTSAGRASLHTAALGAALRLQSDVDF